jgi:hypothetical protein
MLESVAARLIPADSWRSAERDHHDRVDRLVAEHLQRARRGERHPGEDFLFTYYPFRPGQLRRWHPGAGNALLPTEDATRPPAQAGWRWYTMVDVEGGGRAVTVDVPAFLAERGETVRRLRGLLAATASRPPLLSCFGLHEWAMVYRLPPERIRHVGWPMRLEGAAADAVLESQRVRCTHFDAFRFFTDSARPLNAVRPTRADQVALEQPGCLHATMDLYKVAYKLLPTVPSELVADCFELAREARVLDMRVSPYDVRPLGYEPLAVETPEGRAEFTEEQRLIAERGAVLRARLLQRCTALLDAGRRGVAALPRPVAGTGCGKCGGDHGDRGDRC